MLNSSKFLENFAFNSKFYLNFINFFENFAFKSTMEETVFSSFLWWAGLKGEEHITRSTIRRSARVQCRSGEISAPVACRAPLQWPHVALLCSRTESPTISRHEIADWNCKDSDGKYRMLMVQCRSGEISASAAPHSNDLLSHGYVRAQSRQQFHVMKSLIETAKIRMENIACWC